MLLLSGLFLGLDRHYPLPDPNRINSIIILSQDKTPLRAFADRQGVWRYPVTLDEVSPLYLEALLTYEDRWFYWHYGVNPLAMLRAVWQWLRNGKAISGGSTLTMQVARILEPHERSIRGKLWQMFRALQLEWHYDKDEILTFYLNLAPFGGPIEGVQAASHAYLRKSASALSHAEAALLAVLPQSPSRLRPDRFPERAQAYRDKVLRRLQQLGVWESPVVDEALIERVLRSGFHQPMTAPLLARRLKQQAREKGVARLVSSVDGNLQARVENRVQARLSALPEQASVAVLVMENVTGLVRAYVGSADFFSRRRQGQVDMVQAVRSPGSTLKPFLYGMALEQGLIHSGSLLSDVPLRLGNYAPENFMRTFQGPVSAEQALQLSLNVPAVGLLQRIDPGVFDARLRHVGVGLRYPADERPNLSLILGGAGTRLESLVRGFSAFARAGISIRPRFEVDDPVVERRLVSPETGWVVGEILRGVAPPGGYSNQVLRLAWKTGTSYGFRDAWAIGVNSRYSVGVWTGRPDGTPLPGRYGAMAAGPLLFDIFQVLPQAVSRWPRPSGVEREWVCWPLGRLERDTLPEDCHRRLQAWVIEGVVPATLPNSEQASWSAGRRFYWLNPASGRRLLSTCSTGQRVQASRVQWPFELQPWLTERELRRMQLPDLDASCPKAVRLAQRPALNIRHFDDSTRLLLPKAEQGGEVHVRLEAVGGSGYYLWLVNGKVAGHSAENGQLDYRFAQPGQYELTVLDGDANVDKVNIRVVR